MDDLVSVLKGLGAFLGIAALATAFSMLCIAHGIPLMILLLVIGVLVSIPTIFFALLTTKKGRESFLTAQERAVEAVKDAGFAILMICGVLTFGITVNYLSGDFVSPVIEGFFHADLIAVCTLAYLMAATPHLLEKSSFVRGAVSIAITPLAIVGLFLFLASVSVELAGDTVENVLGENLTHELFGEYDEDGEEISPGFFRRKMRDGIIYLIREEPPGPRNDINRMPASKARPKDVMTERMTTAEIMAELEALKDDSDSSESSASRPEEKRDVHPSTTVETRTPTSTSPPKMHRTSRHSTDPRRSSHRMVRPGTEEEEEGEMVDTGLFDTGEREEEEEEKKVRRTRYVPIPIPIPVPSRGDRSSRRRSPRGSSRPTPRGPQPPSSD